MYSEQDTPPCGRAWRVVVLFVFAIALALRLFQIGQESFFVDEGFSLVAVQEDFWHQMIYVEATPPLYFAALKAWVALFGTSHEAVRTLSALSGALSAGLLVIACRRWGMGLPVALAVGLASACSAQGVWYGQQARAYALATMWVSAWLVLAAPVKPAGRTWWRIGGLALVIAFGVATHYYFALVVAGGAAWLAFLFILRRHRDEEFSVLFWGHALGGLLCLPTLWLAWVQFASGVTGWTPKPVLADLRDVWVKQFLMGNAATPPLWLAWSGVAIFILLGFAGAGGALAGIRRGRLAEPRHAFGVAAAALCAGLILPFFISLLASRSVFITYRYSVVSLPIFLFAVGAACQSIPRTRLRLAVGGLTAALVFSCSIRGLAAIYSDFQDFDWRGAIRLVESEWQPGDTVLFLPGWQRVSWESNGGGEVPAPENPLHSGGRIWMLVWLGSGDEEQLALFRDLDAREGAETRIDFPHIKLIEVPGGGH